jgi:hypothetical protein
MHIKFRKIDIMCMAVLGILIGFLVPLEQSTFADSNGGSPPPGDGGGSPPPGDGGGSPPPGDGGGSPPPGDGGGSHHSKHHSKHHHSGSSFSTVKGSKHGGLIQIPSNKTDYPDNDPTVINVHVSSAKKDIIGDYEIKGEVTNVGSDALRFVHITAHVYDAAGQLVGNGDTYTTPTDLDPQHTGTFDIFVTKDTLSGKPVSYRLSYDWS